MKKIISGIIIIAIMAILTYCEIIYFKEKDIDLDAFCFIMFILGIFQGSLFMFNWIKINDN
jgi:hypothetical protein